MKRILVVGAGSYIGSSFAEWVSQNPRSYIVDTVDVRGGLREESLLETYDALLHVAGIVHVKEKRIEEYSRVNRDLAVSVAREAKARGVKQFIFLSTLGVYGMESGAIDADTVPMPETPYAKSKYEAEQLLSELASEGFRVAILRVPIVYGRGCKGNYPRLARLASILPVFPSVRNERSMIYVDNLCEFLRQLVERGIGGLYFPQNREYVNTSHLIELIASANRKPVRITSLLNWAIPAGLWISSSCRKLLGSFTVDRRLPGGPEDPNSRFASYEVVSFAQSIYRAEGVAAE